ncbi:Predicted transcriptional regulator [uncultured Eubacterium sp.]|nr:Predicted transcriptional regulator [uncultured Eubacterium sp.]
MDYIKTGEELRQIRKDRGFSQEKLAELAEVSISTIRRLERGTRSSFNLKTVELVANVLGIQVYSLFAKNEFRALLQGVLEEEFRSNEELEEEVDWRVQIQILFFPNTEYLSEYPIRTLLEFLVYLPLMNWFRLINMLTYRINGDMSSNGCYVCEILKSLYDEIPDNEAKYFADVISEKLKYKFQYNQYADSQEMTEYIKEHTQRELSEKYSVGRKKYHDRLKYLSEMANTLENLIGLGGMKEPYGVLWWL